MAWISAGVINGRNERQTRGLLSTPRLMKGADWQRSSKHCGKSASPPIASSVIRGEVAGGLNKTRQKARTGSRLEALRQSTSPSVRNRLRCSRRSHWRCGARFLTRSRDVSAHTPRGPSISGGAARQRRSLSGSDDTLKNSTRARRSSSTQRPAACGRHGLGRVSRRHGCFTGRHPARSVFVTISTTKSRCSNICGGVPREEACQL